ncbi:MAG TPA: hypothetical protein VK642_14825 [Burkholderiales bacterium]|nr:hypothetical protein [Burkholderiales bacterium]
MDSVLQQYLDDLKSLRRAVNTETTKLIGKKQLRESAEELGTRWFKGIASDLTGRYKFSAELVERYSTHCKRLIKLSGPNNLKTSYLGCIDGLTKSMRDELILPIKASAGTTSPTVFDSFVASLKDPGESAYFQEALDCAKQGYLRGATVLGWCAAIDRIHRTIELKGFVVFNVCSAQMASQQKGRFKRFNQTQNVTSLSELREVFDTIVLWIIEGMNLIDSNQHTRLRSCFEMRCHCAHPGEAPITEYNLMSFFSDIQQIILENKQFEI